jgi:hypothetical protein
MNMNNAVHVAEKLPPLHRLRAPRESYDCLDSYGVLCGRAAAQAVSGRLRAPRESYDCLDSYGVLCGRAAAQAVSGRLRAQVRSCGQVFSKYSSIIWGWYTRPTSGRSTKWTQSHSMRKTIIIIIIIIQICLCGASSLTRGAMCPLPQVMASCTHSQCFYTLTRTQSVRSPTRRQTRMFTVQFSK